MRVDQLLAERLSAFGVQRVWGEPLGDLPHVPVADPDLAVLLADLDGRIGHGDGRGRLGAAVLAGPILHLSSRPGGRAPLQTVGSVEELLDALVDPPGVLVPGTTAVHLDLDLDDEVPDGVTSSVEPERSTVLTLDPGLADLRLVAVVGPGVVRAGALEGLRSFSRTAGAGVLNTWGAKGVERWDSAWHLGTAGLQEADIALGGVADAEMVVTSGLDVDEVPRGGVDHPLLQDVPAGQLAALCARWPAAGRPVEPSVRGTLFGSLAAVVRPLYESDGAPLEPARAALHLSGVLPDGAMAVADAGPAGFWVARAFPTSVPNSVCVPSTAADGAAVAAAVVAAVEGRPLLAVTDEHGLASGPTAALLELADALGLDVRLQVWTDDGPSWDTASEHVALMERQLGGGGVQVERVPVRWDATASLEEIAGPVAAWGGIRLG